MVDYDFLVWQTVSQTDTRARAGLHTGCYGVGTSYTYTVETLCTVPYLHELQVQARAHLPFEQPY